MYSTLCHRVSGVLLLFLYKCYSTDTVPLSSIASLEQTNGNEQQVVGHHGSMLEDGNSSISEGKLHLQYVFYGVLH